MEHHGQVCDIAITDENVSSCEKEEGDVEEKEKQDEDDVALECNGAQAKDWVSCQPACLEKKNFLRSESRD